MNDKEESYSTTKWGSPVGNIHTLRCPQTWQLEIPELNKWSFIAGKMIEPNGGFSSKPCLITRGYKMSL